VTLVRIGKVVRAVGLRGHLGVAGTDGGLARLGGIVLRRGEREDAPRRVLEARQQGRIWAVKVEGIDDRGAAERAVGAEVLGDREELGEAGEDRHYWTDLEGLAVVTVAGEAVGKVTGLYETGGVDVLVVRGEGGAEKLVPLAPYVEVDRENGRIVVDPPEGLLD
jgi:16S rRNA processing protein RimM